VAEFSESAEKEEIKKLSVLCVSAVKWIEAERRMGRYKKD
jgi:hypothetical protein